MGFQRSPVRLTVVMVFLSLACQASAPAPVRLSPASPAPELRISLAGLPATTDPALTQVHEGAVARAVFEPLLKPRADLADVVPAAAERFEISPDGLTYTFRIRPRARWSDGSVVRAEDFVSGWRQILDPRVNSPWGDLLAARIRGARAYSDLAPGQDAARIPAFLTGIGIRAVDEATFVVELEQPAPDFKWIAAVPQLAPRRGDATATGARLGNGAFQVRSASAQEVVLAANPHYWAGAPRVGRIVLSARGAGDEVAAFRAGDHQLSLLSAAGAEAAGHDASLAGSLLKVTRLEQTWIQFNVHEPPFDDPRVRLAFAKAIDRRALVAQVLKGLGVASVGLIPAGLPDHRPGLAAQQFDVAGARELLTSAGVKPAVLTQLHLLVRDLAPDRQLAEFVAAQIREHLAVDLVLEVKPSKEVSRRLATGRFQLQGPAGWVADYADERDWMDLFLTEHFSQSSRYSSSAYDHLVGQADRELDPAARRQRYLQAQQLLVEDAPVAFLFQSQSWYLLQPYVKGLRSSPLDAWPGDAAAGEIVIGRH